MTRIHQWGNNNMMVMTSVKTETTIRSTSFLPPEPQDDEDLSSRLVYHLEYPHISVHAVSPI